MQIKRLRLTGFKSFVEPTELRIEPGLTGVVGPNGCGKSNLLEAIRWVMGESSPKSMRGGGMEDVIFAGTATRPARDFAEVALICDVAGQQLASVLSGETGTELEVIRRIERGTGSAYRVNSRDVRAKDVALIFADAATGAHSPALVSQGKIAAVIAAKPTERRQMLEEAAGIAGLHVRRKDAEQKLRATEANLVRLSEIIADMDMRIGALRRQARAAERYTKLTGAIRMAEARMIYARWRDAAAAADRARADAGAAEAAVRTAQTTAAAGEAAQRTATATLANARAAAQSERGTLATLATDLARVTGEEQAARQRLADLNAQQARLTEDRSREGDLARDAHTALVTLDAASKELAAELASHGAARAALDSADAAAQGGLRDAEVALAQARATAAGEAAERRIAQSALDTAIAAQRRAMAETARLAQDLAALGDAGALAAAVSASEAAVAEQEGRIADAERALGEAEHKRAASDDALAAAGAALAERQAALTTVDSEAAALNRALASDHGGGARALDQIRAAPGFEAALAAALGDDLDAEVGDMVARGWRGGAVPVSDPALPAGTQALAEQVTAPPALLRRLRQIAVADSDNGQALAVGQRLVTTGGTMRRWDGFVSSGDGAVAAERLARHNRVDTLTAQRPEIELAIARFTQRRSASALEAAAAREAMAAARTALAAADGERRNALRWCDTARGAVERHGEASALYARRRTELAAALAEAEGALTQEQAALAALPDAALAHGAQLAAEQLADRARAAASESRAAIGGHERQLATIKERQAVAASEARSWKDRAGEAARRVGDMDKRAAALGKELAALASAPDRLAAARMALEAQRTDQSAATVTADAAERAADGAVQSAEAALAVQREALASAREQRAGAAARAENADLRRIEMGRLSGERFECPPPLLPEKAGFESQDVRDPATESARHDQLIAERERLGPVNLVATEELAALEDARARSTTEIEELTQAVNRLRGSIGNLNREGRVRLLAAFEAVNGHFQRLFATLFDGGQAHLELVDADDPLEAGLEIMAQPPGKRLGTLTLLSGGEQALTAIALIFALFLTNPAPICVLDEVDAPLDDANIERFCDLLDRMVHETATRYLIVTHNAVTMARMHRLFGVTMVEQGVSRLVSVDLGGAEDLLAAE